MKNSDRGQTVIETALMILLLFVLFFGIAEIARFWWLKNQVNNAARVGVRVAITDSTLDASGLSFDCSLSGTSCGTTSASQIAIATCSSITNNTLCADPSGHVAGTVAVTLNSGALSGGTVELTVTRPNIITIVPGLAGILFPARIDLSSSSTMRHE